MHQTNDGSGECHNGEKWAHDHHHVHDEEECRGRVQRRAVPVLTGHVEQVEHMNGREDTQRHEPDERRAGERMSHEPAALVGAWRGNAHEACPREQEHVADEHRVERAVQHAPHEARPFAQRPVAEHDEDAVQRHVARHADQVDAHVGEYDAIEGVEARGARAPLVGEERAQYENVDDQHGDHDGDDEHGGGQRASRVALHEVEEAVEHVHGVAGVLGRLGEVVRVLGGVEAS